MWRCFRTTHGGHGLAAEETKAESIFKEPVETGQAASEEAPVKEAEEEEEDLIQTGNTASEEAIVKEPEEGDNDAPTQPHGSEYSVVVTRAEGEKWGMDLEFVGTALMPVLAVTQVSDSGAVKSFNEVVAPGDMKIEIGHGIVEVNGNRGDHAELLESIQAATNTLSMTLRLPTEHRVAINKQGNQLGLVLSPRDSGMGAIVMRVGRGAVPSSRVWVGDCLIGVNGEGGTSEELKEKIQAQDELELLFYRYT